LIIARRRKRGDFDQSDGDPITQTEIAIHFGMTVNDAFAPWHATNTWACDEYLPIFSEQDVKWDFSSALTKLDTGRIWDRL
jgi:hypothetical protein